MARARGSRRHEGGEPHRGLLIAGIGCAGVAALGLILGTGALVMWHLRRGHVSPAAPTLPHPVPAATASRPALAKGTCATTARCCRSIVRASGGGDPSVCDNFLSLPDGSCGQALQTYRTTAKNLGLRCE